MVEELVEGKNIGSLPDPFPFLSNEKIMKVKSDLNVDDEYLAMYEESLSEVKEIKVGDVVSGKITNINEKELTININYKDEVYVDKPKVGTFTNELQVGDEIDVLITKVSNNPYIIKGSVTELIKMKVHSKMKDYYSNKLPLTAKVLSSQPAGYLLDIHMDNITIPAFMPNTLADVNKLSDPESIIGETFNVMLETLQQEKGVYVVSRRKYLQSLIPNEINKIKTGEMMNNVVFTGIVTGTTPFGVFVQFSVGDGPDCLTGMIHKANMEERWQNDWHKIKAGMEIEFYVKEIIKKNKIILTQILKESLWDTIKVHKVLDGVIRDIKNFGALITLDEETTGLIQTSYINKYDKKLNIGDNIKVKVISLIRDDRKIYLNFADVNKKTE